jgi:hypothetical protein
MRPIVMVGWDGAWCAAAAVAADEAALERAPLSLAAASLGSSIRHVVSHDRVKAAVSLCAGPLSDSAVPFGLETPLPPTLV